MNNKSLDRLDEPIQETSFEKYLRERWFPAQQPMHQIEKKTQIQIEKNTDKITELFNAGQIRKCKHCLKRKMIGSYCEICSTFAGNL